MAIVFHSASGSPYAWRVALSLEHKRLPYETTMHSFDSGELKTPEYLAINPRGKVPAIVDDGFAIWESAAIVEYLDQAYPDSGAPLFPRDAREAATVRRLVREADQYVQPPMERLVDHILFTREADRDPAAIAAARDELAEELARWEAISTEWLAGTEGPTAADYALYPMLALVRRLETRFGGFALMRDLGPRLGAFMRRVEALPYYGVTYPPHWR